MASTAAIIGAGTRISYAAHPTPGTFTDLAEVFSVGFPEMSENDVRATHYLSPGRVHEYISGWREGGEVTVEANYVKAEMATVHGMRGQMRTWRITLPDGATETWPGYIKTIWMSIPMDDKVTTTLTIKVAGDPTYTPGV